MSAAKHQGRHEREASVAWWAPWVLALLSVPAVARAQATLEPPRILETAEPSLGDLDPEAVAGAEVVLRLVIDAEGTVTAAEVLESAGPELDAVAQDALMRSRFEPARRDGAPIAARIAFRFVFPPAPAPAPSNEPEATAPPPTSPPPESEPSPSQEPMPEPLGVTARVEADRGGVLERSAEAVDVVDTRAQRGRAVDLGDVLARTEGVAVRRSGGLGSGARFSLNGLYDSQVRLFLDEVPLELAGFPFGIANVPVALVDRIEIYRGVVPIRFGADALGGAVNLVSSERAHRNFVSGSYQTGSFGTYRTSVVGRFRDPSTGLTFGGAAFVDRAANDYAIDVEVADRRGRLHPARVRRFHDAYTAVGGSVELGFVGVPWARRLLLRLYASGYDKELQHNAVMTVPYGEARQGEQVLGGTLRYEQPGLFGPGTELSVLTSVARRNIDFVDRSEWVYDWYGDRVRPRRVAGEIAGIPFDQSVWQWTSFSRVQASWDIDASHSLRIAITPSYATRTGDERVESNPGGRDPLSAERELFTVVSGLEHRLRLLDEQLESFAFVKHYYYLADSEEVLPGFTFRRLTRDQHYVGVGDALRFRFAEWIWAKASYELATRLPSVDEVFGNGVLIGPNLELGPETSHNVNLGVSMDVTDREVGRWSAELSLFARVSDQLIVLLGTEGFLQYQNVYAATALGAELSAGWVSPGQYVTVELNGTFQDVRNASTDGAFQDFAGDRIPNRPWLFANAAVSVRLPDLLARGDALMLGWSARYVHEFFRGWESQGARAFKQTVPSQLTQDLHLTYRVRGDDGVGVSTTFEVQNFTDEAAFDFFGVQRPGRTFFLKLTADL